MLHDDDMQNGDGAYRMAIKINDCTLWVIVGLSVDMRSTDGSFC